MALPTYGSCKTSWQFRMYYGRNKRKKKHNFSLICIIQLFILYMKSIYCVLCALYTCSKRNSISYSDLLRGCVQKRAHKYGAAYEPART